MKPTLYVANERQKVLFEQEIRGQLSDGHWENATPFNHWVRYAECDVEVTNGSYPAGRNFSTPRKHYRLTDPDLLEVVEQRMLRLVRLSVLYGGETAHHLLDLWEGLGTGAYLGAPTEPGAYWDEERAFLANYDLEKVRRIGEDATYYSALDLRGDLRRLQEAMATNLLLDEHLKKEQQREKNRRHYRQARAHAAAQEEFRQAEAAAREQYDKVVAAASEYLHAAERRIYLEGVY